MPYYPETLDIVALSWGLPELTCWHGCCRLALSRSTPPAAPRRAHCGRHQHIAQGNDHRNLGHDCHCKGPSDALPQQGQEQRRPLVADVAQGRGRPEHRRLPKLSAKGSAAISLNSKTGSATLKLNSPIASPTSAHINPGRAVPSPRGTTAKIGKQSEMNASVPVSRRVL